MQNTLWGESSEPESRGELVPLSEQRIGDDAVPTVNARNLHTFLGVGKDFSTWIKGRIEQYDFIEHHDFVTFQTAPQNGGAGNRGLRIEYHLTLDMSKELAMVERNERGRQARRYFIECERRWKASAGDSDTAMRALADPAKLRHLLANYAERVQQLETTVKEQAPKAEFHDAVADAKNYQSVEDIAKSMGIGRNTMFKFLRDDGVLMRGNNPYQHYIDAGYFKVRERVYEDNYGDQRTYVRTYVTGKGVIFIHRRLVAAGLLERQSA
ncbi:phage antirepressor protein KilAC domain protein [mine drainage metagenome]|uniref:Phage antirepressor protein KilAC domain protein n=1 Tax=mine drainage metagenome TaxID=410659 RepID=A0A1J5PQF3_9ZZZZ